MATGVAVFAQAANEKKIISARRRHHSFFALFFILFLRILVVLALPVLRTTGQQLHCSSLREGRT